MAEYMQVYASMAGWMDGWTDVNMHEYIHVWLRACVFVWLPACLTVGM